MKTFSDGSKVWRPANGEEFFGFASGCNRCRFGENCPILADSMMYKLDDEDYPHQLRETKDGRVICISRRETA